MQPQEPQNIDQPNINPQPVAASPVTDQTVQDVASQWPQPATASPQFVDSTVPAAAQAPFVSEPATTFAAPVTAPSFEASIPSADSQQFAPNPVIEDAVPSEQNMSTNTVAGAQLATPVVKKNKKSLVIILIIGIVVLLGAGGFIAYTLLF
jgi:hypothetical protein